MVVGLLAVGTTSEKEKQVRKSVQVQQKISKGD